MNRTKEELWQDMGRGEVMRDKEAGEEEQTNVLLGEGAMTSVSDK